MHPNCPGVLTFASLPGMSGSLPFVQIEGISPRPLLMILVPGAGHAHLYDQAPYSTQRWTGARTRRPDWRR